MATTKRTQRKTTTAPRTARPTKAKATKAKATKAKATATKPKATARKPKATARPAKATKAKATKVKPAHAMQRADYGKPVSVFYAKVPAATKPIVLALRDLVEAAAPAATASLKWGMPFYEIGATMVAAIGAHASHVNLILPGPEGTYADPRGLLRGEGKTGKHLKLTSLADLPRAEVTGWLATAVARATGARP